MADITFDKLREAAKLMAVSFPASDAGSFEWATLLLKQFGKDVPRSWPRSTPFYTINYSTLVCQYLEALANVS